MTEKKKPIRKAPAYQEYASDMLADARYRMMTLAERGLFDTLRRECWVNSSIPADEQQLSRLLRIPVKELLGALTEDVRYFFEVVEDRIVCPELVKYREQLEGINSKQVVGGQAGGLKTQERRRKAIASAEANLEDDLKLLSGGELIREVGSGEEVSRVFNAKSTDKWVNDFDNAPDAF